jgi:flagellin-like protein
MNVLERRVRSWRKARKRGVSPIIATILLVAITVVLAAVLYVLISGLTHGTGTAPLGTNFSWGVPLNSTGQSGIGCTGSATTYCYTVEIAGSGGGLTTSNFYLSLRNSVGSTVAWPAILSISLVSPSVTTAVATVPLTAHVPGNSWTNAAGFSGTIAGGFSVVIQTNGVGSGAGLFGYSLVAIGQNGYSGTVPSNAFS